MSVCATSGTPKRHTVDSHAEHLQTVDYLARSGHSIRATIHPLSGDSAHADQDALCGFVKCIMRHPPRKICLVHGEPAAKQALRLRLPRICRESRGGGVTK